MANYANLGGACLLQAFYTLHRLQGIAPTPKAQWLTEWYPQLATRYAREKEPGKDPQ